MNDYIGDTEYLKIIGEEIDMVEEADDLCVPFDAYSRLVDVYRICRKAQTLLDEIEKLPERMIENGCTYRNTGYSMQGDPEGKWVDIRVIKKELVTILSKQRVNTNE